MTFRNPNTTTTNKVTISDNGRRPIDLKANFSSGPVEQYRFCASSLYVLLNLEGRPSTNADTVIDRLPDSGFMLHDFPFQIWLELIIKEACRLAKSHGSIEIPKPHSSYYCQVPTGFNFVETAAPCKYSAKDETRWQKVCDGAADWQTASCMLKFALGHLHIEEVGCKCPRDICQGILTHNNTLITTGPTNIWIV